MAGIDNIFIVKQPEALFRISRTVLSENGFETAEDFAPFMINSSKATTDNELLMKKLESIVEDGYDNRKTGRMKKFQLYETTFHRKINENRGFFKEKIPILINGLSIDEYGLRDGLDPYSPEFRFSNKAVELIGTFDESFLKKILLIYIQPNTFIQQFKTHNETTRLEDFLFEEMQEYMYETMHSKGFKENISKEKEQDYNDLIKKVGTVGFGSLTKPSDMLVSTARYRERLFSLRPIKKAIKKSPSTFEKDVLRKGSFKSVKEFLDYHSIKVHIAKTIMALKWKTYLDILWDQFKETIDDYSLQGLPLYMEKTSASSEIIKQAIKLTDKNIPIQYIGGFEGILASKLESEGIHSDTAFNRLTGFLTSIQSIWNENYSRNRISLSKKQVKTTNYESAETYPWVLLEENMGGRSPNMEDLVEEFMTPKHKSIVDAFARRRQTGWCRIEPRLKELMNYQGMIFNGRRNKSKELFEWQKEIEGKQIVLPSQIKSYFGTKATFLKDQDSDEEIDSDFRGSELSSSVNCSIEKTINRLIRDNSFDLLKEIISEEQEEEFYRYFDPDLKEPIAAVRGTKIHEITLQPMERLVHYKTLTDIGLEPVSSDNYCEILFEEKLRNPLTDKEFSISFHPDTLFFLQDKNDFFDIVVIDTKSNRIISSPEVYYLKQTAFYGLMVKKIIEEKGLKTGNIYAILNKNAFDDEFILQGQDTHPFHNINVFRPQIFSPITKFSKGDGFLDTVLENVYTAVQDKQILLEGNQNKFLDIKEEMLNLKKCEHCYFENKTLCDYTNKENLKLTDLMKEKI